MIPPPHPPSFRQLCKTNEMSQKAKVWKHNIANDSEHTGRYQNK